MIADTLSRLRKELHDAPAAPATTDRAVVSCRRQNVQAFFFAHLSLYLAVNILLFIINVLTTAGFWWFLYPLWAWGMLLALHAGITYPWRGLLGAHLAIVGVLSAGLIAIDAATAGGPWWFFPVAALLLTVILHAGLRLDMQGAAGSARRA